MKLLLTNDDAYYARGINALLDELQKRWEVVLVAPDREQSATSHSLTLNRPLRINRIRSNVYSVEGTPADCVLLAVHKLMEEKPAMVVSGINHGPNLGDDVIYSGTVAAAREGAMLGIPSLAVSVTSWSQCRFDFAGRFVPELVRSILEGPCRGRLLLNVNIPNLPADRIRGAAVTRLGVRTYRNMVEERRDPRGKSYYWVSGTPVWQLERDTDYHTVSEDRVSVTPLNLEMTDYNTMDVLRDTVQTVNQSVYTDKEEV